MSDLMMQGVNLMLLGMGSVFIFLTALVTAMYGMSALARALSREEIHEGVSTTTATPAVGDDELIAVISAAISRFRSTNK